MKKIIVMVSAFLVLLSTTAFAMSTKDYDARMAKGLNYYNNGKYFEALDEFTWFKDSHYNSLNDGQKRYLNDYIDKTNKKIDAMTSEVSTGMTTKEYDAKMAKAIDYYNNGKYYEALDEFTWFKDANYKKLNDGQRRYLDNYIDKTNQKINEFSASMNTYEFDYGMSVGIYYFNNGMFYEAKEAFEAFKNSSYSKMNAGQKAYFNDWYNGTVAEVEKLQKAASTMSTYEFDQGMKKGISYFDKGMYNEARDEFMWFYEANENRFNEGQYAYVYDYLMGAALRAEAWEIAAEADNMLYDQYYGYGDVIDYIWSCYDIYTYLDEEGVEYNYDYNSYHGILDNKVDDLCYRWRQELGCPIAITGSYVDRSNYYPEAAVTVRNISGKYVDAFDVFFWCYDAYGNITTDYQYLYNGSFEGWVDDAELYNGEEATYYWDLYDNSRTYYLGGMYITRVAYSDGTVWYR